MARSACYLLTALSTRNPDYEKAEEEEEEQKMQDKEEKEEKDKESNNKEKEQRWRGREMAGKPNKMEET